MNGTLPFLALSMSFATASAGELNISVRSGTAASIQVGPGATVNYSVIGELSDNANQGLAMFAFDLSFTGGPLSQASSPSSGSMLNFASPLGLNNPAGFGGTVAGGILRQVGGAQNTINNVFAPIPSGSVIAGVAAQGSPTVLASGSLTAPSAFGSYKLSASNLFANVIQTGATGIPFWAVEAANAGTNSELTIEVVALLGDKPAISTGVFEKQTLSLNAGPANAGRLYLLLGSMSGTSPGIPFPGGLVLPLNFDGYFLYTLQNPNSAPLSASFGILDGQGQATAIFQPRPRFNGATFHHAFVLLGPLNFVSNSVSVTVLP